jgi:hypothetical protein
MVVFTMVALEIRRETFKGVPCESGCVFKLGFCKPTQFPDLVAPEDVYEVALKLDQTDIIMNVSGRDFGQTHGYYKFLHQATGEKSRAMLQGCVDFLERGRRAEPQHVPTGSLEAYKDMLTLATAYPSGVWWISDKPLQLATKKLAETAQRS